MMTRRITTRTSFKQSSDETILMVDPINGSPATSNGHSSSPRNCSAWTMTSLMEVLPESPSPICSKASTNPLRSSSFSPKSDTFFPQFPTESLTPRNQNFRTVEVEEWVKLAKRSGRFYQTNMQNYYPQGRENLVPEDYSYQACSDSILGGGSETRSPLQDSLISRPKPYSTFLDEVRKQELETEIETWRKVKQIELIEKLRRKEAAISEWEWKETSKFVEEMKKLESKLEKKRAKALAKLEKRIGKTKAKANKKSTKARRSTIEKITTVSKISARVRATKSFLWTKLMRLS
ncbi:hypothetical protein UlMin_021454 [Ulmus minor]